MPKAGQQSFRRLASAAVRRELALDMYVNQGKTYQQVADALGYCDRGSAHRAIHTALSESAARTAEIAEVARPVVVARLDRLYARWCKRAESEEKAAEIVLKIIDRYIRVMGLDKVQIEATVTTRTQLDADIEQLLGEVIQLRNPGTAPAIERTTWTPPPAPEITIPDPA